MHQRVAWVAAALTGLFMVTGVVFVAMEPVPRAMINAIVGSSGILWAGLGIAVTRRESGRTVGVLMTLIGANLAFTCAREAGWSVLAAHPEYWNDFDELAAVLAESAWWLFASLAILLLVFPTGHVPRGWWRALPPVILISTSVNYLTSIWGIDPIRPPLEAMQHPFAPPPAWVEILGGISFFPMLLGGLVAACSPLVRFFRTGGIERQQLKWLAFGGLGVPGFPLVCLLEIAFTGSTGWPSGVVGVVALLGMPTGIAIAMLRHELYDVDRVIAAAVTYTTATAILAAVFLGCAAAGGLLLGGNSALAAAAATAITAAALAPVRRLAMKQVDRRLYPALAAATAAIDDLEQRTHAGEARPEQLEQQLRVALKDPGLRVGYRLPGTPGLVDSAGLPVAGDSAVPIEMEGLAIGALLPAGAGHSPKLLREVARRAGTLAEIVRLRVELTAAVRGLEESRARLVAVGDEERRRLERDLHDGAQQRLVSLGMSLRLAQRHLKGGVVDVDALIDQSVAELGTAVAELRQIAHGLRPSRLDDGLQPALAALSRSLPLPVDLDVTTVELPDPVATTVYFIASEALTNAVKHADATRIGVKVVRSDSAVEVSVQDDGKGGAVFRHGSGLAGLRERVAAIGGSLSVDSAAGGGTLVSAVVPCAS